VIEPLSHINSKALQGDIYLNIMAKHYICPT